MSELKAYTYDDMIDGDADTNIEYYPKSEADKVIAKLEEKLDTTEKLLNKELDCISNGKNHMMSLARKCNHANYKRCLAMAMWCGDAYDKWMMRKAKAIGLGKDGVEEYHRARRKLFNYMKWQTRWLEFADKFKEAK